MSRWLIVVNPTAGDGRAASPAMRALTAALAAELHADIATTDGPGHATEIAAGAADRAGLAVVGGDGTIAEVVDGMDRVRQMLLVVAAGTGNGLARDLGLARPGAALAAVRRPHFTSLDLARATFRAADGWHARLMVSTAGLGLVADAADRAERGYKRLRTAGYPLAAMRQVFSQRPFEAVVRLDGRPARTLTLTNAMVNTTCHAGNFAVFPGTDPHDGRLRVLLARAGMTAQLAHAASVLTRTYAFTTGREYEARAVSLTLARPGLLMLDGELWPEVSAVRIDAMPAALARVIVGPRWRGPS